MSMKGSKIGYPYGMWAHYIYCNKTCTILSLVTEYECVISYFRKCMCLETWIQINKQYQYYETCCVFLRYSCVVWYRVTLPLFLLYLS
jgi:hypothetical protein